MIHFKKVRWKNFLSTGNQFTEVLLDRSPTTLIVGENGSGKSTMLDALCFGLFGKAYRPIKKNQLINSINTSGAVVEVEFGIGKNEFKVVRSIKPNDFQIIKNGEPMDQEAHSRDFQKILEDSILKLNYKSFTQVVILGSSCFIPFMQLSTNHRREIVEDILDIKIFSTMNMDSILPKIMRGKYFWIMPQHKFYFTNSTLKFFLKKNKMNIFKIKNDARLVSIEYLLFKLCVFLPKIDFIFKFLLKFNFLKKITIKINLFDLNIYFANYI